MAELEEVTYDLAHQALRDQAAVVDGLRARTGPLVAAATAVTGLLAKPATADAHGLRLVVAVVGFVAAGVAIAAAIDVLRSRELGFSIDSDGLYEVARVDRDKPKVFYLRLAGTLRETRRRNEPDVNALHRSFTIGLAGLVVEVLGLAVAVAVA